MKNVDELYEKYCNVYKNDYDSDKLSEVKKTKFDYKQFFVVWWNKQKVNTR